MKQRLKKAFLAIGVAAILLAPGMIRADGFNFNVKIGDDDEAHFHFNDHRHVTRKSSRLPTSSARPSMTFGRPAMTTVGTRALPSRPSMWPWMNYALPRNTTAKFPRLSQASSPAPC